MDLMLHNFITISPLFEFSSGKIMPKKKMTIIINLCETDTLQYRFISAALNNVLISIVEIIAETAMLRRHRFNETSRVKRERDTEDAIMRVTFKLRSSMYK